MSPWRWGGTPFTHGCFPTPDGRARMLPIKQVAPAEPLARWPINKVLTNCATGCPHDGGCPSPATLLRPPIGRHHRRFVGPRQAGRRSEEHTSELQSLMRISYAVFCLKKKNTKHNNNHT